MKITVMETTNENIPLKTLNINEIKKIICQENKFISSLWERLPLPLIKIEEESDLNNIIRSPNDKRKLNLLKNPTKGRAKTYEELHDKFQELKGKKTTYQENMKKKNLKNRMKKARKKEELKKSKKIINSSRNIEIAEKKPKIKPTKPVFNSEGKMVFSRFDFSERPSLKKKKEDPKKILKKLEIRNERIKKLESHGNVEKANELKDKIAWDSALKKAAGEKIKDKPELLKKTLKTSLEKKRRNKKKWEAREEMVKKKQVDKQKKRTESIEKRKKQVKLKKMKKAAKKGRYIPGL